MDGRSTDLPSRSVDQGQSAPSIFKYGVSGALIPKVTLLPSHQYASALSEETLPNGNHLVRGMRVFRTGTFTDMFGNEHTWDDSHLDLMVAHFTLLRESQIFPNVPVRQDHFGSVAGVVGYYDKLYRDPGEPEYLDADIEFTEPEAYQKWKRGTWRSRSIEIGMYETNDKASYFPTVMGLAFVDIPAVEGLHQRPKDAPVFYSRQAVLDNEETTTMHKTDAEWAKDPSGWALAAVYAQSQADLTTAINYAQALVDWERAAVYAQALEDEAKAQNDPTGHGRPAPTPAPAPLMQFRVGGQMTSDYARIQTHIDSLEGFVKETTEATRTSFVEKLGTDNKIAASQIPGLLAHALSLTDEQFMSFRASYDNAPSLSMFGGQAEQGGSIEPPNTGTPPKADDVETLKGIVQHHKHAGKSFEDIAKLPSAKKLVALGHDLTTII